jgi:uncharacterized protein
MQFLILARDGRDPDGPSRRQKIRPDHLSAMSRLKASGNFIFGGAILDEHGTMTGSAVVFDFPDRAALDAWLAREPYVTGNVWQEIEVQPFRAALVE